jgi:hypothetical protein
MIFFRKPVPTFRDHAFGRHAISSLGRALAHCLDHQHFRVPRLLPLLKARKYRRQDGTAARALTGKERERCHDHNEDGRYERGKGDKLHGGTEATVHTRNQGKMRPAVNDGGKKMMREEIAGSERNRAGPGCRAR